MHRLVLVLLFALVCVGAGALALRARDREEAARLVAEAERLLAVSFEQAPGLERLEAARARARLEAAIELDAGSRVVALHAYAVGLEEMQKGRLEPARRALDRARAVLGDDARLSLLAAEIALVGGKSEEARRQLARALARVPSDPRARRLHAELSLASAPAHALAVVAALLVEYPTVGVLYDLRGRAHEALGQSEAALGDFELAIERDGSSSAPCVNRGRLLRLAGRHREAEASFAEAIGRSTEDADAWLGRGLSRIAQGDLEGGALDVEHARSLAPAEPGPLVALGDVEVARANPERAVDLYRAALLADAGHAVAWLKLGNACMRTGELECARQGYARATELSPDLAAAHNGLGAVRMRLGDTAGANLALARAATLDPNDPNPLLNLALLRRRAGDEAGASDAMTEALARGYAP